MQQLPDIHTSRSLDFRGSRSEGGGVSRSKGGGSRSEGGGSRSEEANALRDEMDVLVRILDARQAVEQ
jgi:hypothetical protein